ncbi:MAG: hypothetical protein LBP79_04575 [Clostridiales bacterium]|jgi:hypothetical protein|nr:hypothetical protein [Clostridiales bacterium]
MEYFRSAFGDRESGYKSAVGQDVKIKSHTTLAGNAAVKAFSVGDASETAGNTSVKAYAGGYASDLGCGGVNGEGAAATVTANVNGGETTEYTPSEFEERRIRREQSMKILYRAAVGAPVQSAEANPFAQNSAVDMSAQNSAADRNSVVSAFVRSGAVNSFAQNSAVARNTPLNTAIIQNTYVRNVGAVDASIKNPFAQGGTGSGCDATGGSENSNGNAVFLTQTDTGAKNAREAFVPKGQKIENYVDYEIKRRGLDTTAQNAYVSMTAARGAYDGSRRGYTDMRKTLYEPREPQPRNGGCGADLNRRSLYGGTGARLGAASGGAYTRAGYDAEIETAPLSDFDGRRESDKVARGGVNGGRILPKSYEDKVAYISETIKRNKNLRILEPDEELSGAMPDNTYGGGGAFTANAREGVWRLAEAVEADGGKVSVVKPREIRPGRIADARRGGFAEADCEFGAGREENTSELKKPFLPLFKRKVKIKHETAGLTGLGKFVVGVYIVLAAALAIFIMSNQNAASGMLPEDAASPVQIEKVID